MDMSHSTTKEVNLFIPRKKKVSETPFAFPLGYLPRVAHLKQSPDYLPPFIDPQEWTLEEATFGQNDYIGL